MTSRRRNRRIHSRPRFSPGIRIKYSDGVIYQVQPDGSFRREDGGKVGKAEKKAAKKQRIVSRQDAKAQREKRASDE